MQSAHTVAPMKLAAEQVRRVLLESRSARMDPDDYLSSAALCRPPGCTIPGAVPKLSSPAIDAADEHSDSSNAAHANDKETVHATNPNTTPGTRLTVFDELYFDPERQANYGFSSYVEAMDYARHVSHSQGFALRCKTTGVNEREGLVYKYVCCQRQGLAVNGWRPKTGIRQRQRDSVRCDCRWACKLLGVRISHQYHADIHRGADTSDAFGTTAGEGAVKWQDEQQHSPLHGPSSRRDTDTDFVWIWKRAESHQCFPHNHPLNLDLRVVLPAGIMQVPVPKGQRRHGTSVTLSVAGSPTTMTIVSAPPLSTGPDETRSAVFGSRSASMPPTCTHLAHSPTYVHGQHSMPQSNTQQQSTHRYFNFITTQFATTRESTDHPRQLMPIPPSERPATQARNNATHVTNDNPAPPSLRPVEPAMRMETRIDQYGRIGYRLSHYSNK